VTSNVIRAAVVREEGTNGDREMVAAFHMAGFEVWDVTMTDLVEGRVSLDRFQGVIFPGGFSYADVLGSAKGWAAGIKFNPSLYQQFEAFRQRKETFSLGVCNGCQLLAMFGWVSPEQGSASTEPSQGVHLSRNLSERFESRFSTVRIEKSPSIMLQGMEGSVLGVWVAHGEGRFVFKTNEIEQHIEKSNLVAVRYVDDRGEPTLQYPLNPNGSVGGIAGLCSEDGRHLIMMPHPERCVLPWQWAWWPQSWDKNKSSAPWIKMFQNAYQWCQKH
jgi:phosphoribosylformylglycinamidine synthase